MNDLNLLGHIRSAIDKYLSFLKNYGFDRVREEQLAHEYHFVTRNKCVKVDIWFEFCISTPIWVSIDNYSIELLEPENYRLVDLAKKRKSLLLDNRSFDDLARHENFDRYRLFGKQLNDEYLKEVANILHRNDRVLNGDLSIMAANHQLRLDRIESEAVEHKRQDKIYTCEFDCAFGECYYESNSIDDIKSYLLSNHRDTGLSNIRVYNWDSNLIPFTLD
jgi:hypothetical protein